MISERMKILNRVIPIPIHFCSFISNWSGANRIVPHFIQQNMMELMMSKCFLQLQISDVIQSDVALQKQVH